VNTSGTAMTLMNIVGATTEAGLLASFTGLPIPVLTGIRAVTKQVKDNKTKARIIQALNKAENAQKP